MDFARDSLKPTLLAQFSMKVLEQQLKKPLGEARARESPCGTLRRSASRSRRRTCRSPSVMWPPGNSTAPRSSSASASGRQEMELAQPRWAEDVASVEHLLKIGQPTDSHPAGDATLQQALGKDRSTEAKLNSFLMKWLARHLDRLHTYLGLRETAKHYLMRGYALIRQSLMELDRRFHLNGGIFFLIPEELPLLIPAKTSPK